MSKKDSAGVYQKKDGYWAYRFGIVVGGKTIVKRKYTDEFGNKLKTKREAIVAREAAMVAVRSERMLSKISLLLLILMKLEIGLLIVFFLSGFQCFPSLDGYIILEFIEVSVVYLALDLSRY